MKKTLLAIALAAGTTLFAAAPQATPAPETQAPAKTHKTKAKKVRKARKHHKKSTTTTTSALPRK
jgi:Ni/Co efflux regulator RcnB